MNVVLVHGIGGQPGAHWQQWLRDELIQHGVNVVMPYLPDAEHPDRDVWLKTIKYYCDQLDPGQTIIVGHSLGVTTALDYIEQLEGKLKSLISVAGFAMPYGADLNQYFLVKKEVNFEKVNRNLLSATVIYSDNDPYVTQQALKNLSEQLNVTPVIIPNGGHLNTEAGYTEFKLLLDKIIEQIND